MSRHVICALRVVFVLITVAILAVNAFAAVSTTTAITTVGTTNTTPPFSGTVAVSYGDQVVATVSSTSTVNVGTLDFYADATSACTGGTLFASISMATAGDGTATTTIPISLSTGAHVLTACYHGGTPSFGSSNSYGTPVDINIGKPTPSVTVNASNSTLGASTTITVDVNAATASSTNPLSGQVKLMDGTAVIGLAGTGATSNTTHTATATFTVSILARGGHSLTATYIPDTAASANFNGNSTTSAVAQNVGPRGTGTVVTAVNPGGTPAGSVMVRQSGTATVTVTDSIFGANPETFTNGSTLGTARSGQAAALLPNGTVAIVGGLDSTSAVISGANVAEAYTPGVGFANLTLASGTFSPRVGGTATRLRDGTILLLGGSTDGTAPHRTGTPNDAAAQIYDPVTNAVTSSTDLLTERWHHTATLMADGRVLIVGGENSSGALTSVEIYDPSGPSFTKVGDLAQSLTAHAAALLTTGAHAGSVLVMGGYQGTSPGTPTTAAFFINGAGTVTASAATLNFARVFHTATALADGIILVSGGSVAATPVNTNELYDSTSDTFVNAHNMNAANGRSSFTSTLLLDGTVLLAGGVNSTATTLNTSELYTPAYGPQGSVTLSSDSGSATNPPVPDTWLGCTLVLNGTGASSCTNGAVTPNHVNSTTAHQIYAGYYPNWTTDKPYSVGDLIVPSNDNGNGYVYQCATAGISGATAPTFNTTAGTPGQTVTDGTVVWTNAGSPNTNHSTSSDTLGQTLTVRQQALTLTATANTKVYDGNVDDLTKAPAVTSGSLLGTDIITLTQTYNLATVAGATTLTPVTTNIIKDSVSSQNVTGDYLITPVTAAGTITAAPVTLTANSFHKTYGATYTPTGTEFSATSGTIYNSDITGVTLTSTGFANTATYVAPGPTYTITPSAATGPGIGNYTISYAGGTLTMDQAPVTLTANSFHKNYGTTYTPLGTEFTATSGTIYNSEITAVTLTSAGFAGTATYIAPGPTYTITPSAAAGTGVGNYNITYGNGTLTMNQAPLTVTANSFSKNYGLTYTPVGTEFTTSGTLYNGDTVTGATLTSGGFASTATYTAPGPTYVITPATATGSGAGNYNITYANGTLTINQAAVTLTANSFSKVYGTTYTPAGTEFSATSGTIYNSDITGVTLASGGFAVGATYVAPGPTYTITPSAATGPGVGNYIISYGNGTLTLTRAALTVTANSLPKVYGTTYTPAGTEFTTTPASLPNGDSVSGVTLASTGFGVGATYVAPGPAYPITPSAAAGTGLGNYNITYADGTLSITQAPLTVTANSFAKAYGSTYTPAGSEFTLNPAVLPNGDAVTGVTLVSGGFANTTTYTAPGPTYPITPSVATGPGVGNYNITYSGGTLTITQAPLTVTANSFSKGYGVTYTPAGTEFTATGTLYNGDSVTGVTLNSSGFAQGATVGAPGPTYAITPSVATGSGVGNYSVTYVNGTLTVVVAHLTITADPQTKVYGAANPTLTYTLSGFQNGDTAAVVTGAPTLTTAATVASHVVGGPYVITVVNAGTLAAADYDFPNLVNGQMTVTPAPLSVTPDGGKSKTYGTVFSAFTGNVVGLQTQNGDAVTITYDSPGAASTALVGAYSITVANVAFTPGVATDYTISTAAAAGGLTINQAPLAIKANDRSKLYHTILNYTGGPSEFTATGLANADTVTGVTLTFQSNAASDVNAPFGNYTIEPSAALGSGLSNYTITYQTGNLVVGQVNTATGIGSSVAVAVNDAGGTFSFSVIVSSQTGVPTGTVTFTDNGTTIGTKQLDGTGSASLTGITLATSATPHAIKATYTCDNLNYNGSSVTVYVTASPKPTAIMAGTPASPTISVTYSGAPTASGTLATANLSCTVQSAVVAVSAITSCAASLSGPLNLGATGSLSIAITTSQGTVSSTQPTVTAGNRAPSGMLRALASLTFTLPAVVFMGLAAPLSDPRKKLLRRKLLACLGLVAVLSVLLLSMGCGGAGFSNPNKLAAVGSLNRTQAGSYTAIVTYTDATNKSQALASLPFTVN